MGRVVRGAGSQARRTPKSGLANRGQPLAPRWGGVAPVFGWVLESGAFRPPFWRVLSRPVGSSPDAAEPWASSRRTVSPDSTCRRSRCASWACQRGQNERSAPGGETAKGLACLGAPRRSNARPSPWPLALATTWPARLGLHHRRRVPGQRRRLHLCPTQTPRNPQSARRPRPHPRGVAVWPVCRGSHQCGWMASRRCSS